MQNYIDNPNGWGSNHEHGGAVDITLTDLLGNELSMPTDYDNTSTKASRSYAQCFEEEKKNALILQDAMQKQGFIGLDTEWWHFDDVLPSSDLMALNRDA